MDDRFFILAIRQTLAESRFPGEGAVSITWTATFLTVSWAPGLARSFISYFGVGSSRENQIFMGGQFCRQPLADATKGTDYYNRYRRMISERFR